MNFAVIAVLTCCEKQQLMVVENLCTMFQKPRKSVTRERLWYA